MVFNATFNNISAISWPSVTNKADLHNINEALLKVAFSPSEFKHILYNCFVKHILLMFFFSRFTHFIQ
jgi:hypothetical protein